MPERTFSLCCYSFVPYPHSDSNPKFALGADVYAHIPFQVQKKYNDKNHALGIWLDIETQEWVVRKEYREQTIQTINMSDVKGIMLSSGSTTSFQEAYRGKNFQEALDMCTILSNKYWESETEWIACSHNYELHCCKKYRDRYALKRLKLSFLNNKKRGKMS